MERIAKKRKYIDEKRFLELKDFMMNWSGSNKKAALILNVSESTITRVKNNNWNEYNNIKQGMKDRRIQKKVNVSAENTNKRIGKYVQTPTWADYMVHLMVQDGIANNDDNLILGMWMASTHIPVDVALKLGLKPPETNGDG